MNEEFLVNASHQLALITSLPLVHTARRTYRLNGPVNTLDLRYVVCKWMVNLVEVVYILYFRGWCSRNKVSLGEPAEGSFESCVAHRVSGEWRYVL